MAHTPSSLPDDVLERCNFLQHPPARSPSTDSLDRDSLSAEHELLCSALDLALKLRKDEEVDELVDKMAACRQKQKQRMELAAGRGKEKTFFKSSGFRPLQTWVASLFARAHPLPTIDKPQVVTSSASSSNGSPFHGGGSGSSDGGGGGSSGGGIGGGGSGGGGSGGPSQAPQLPSWASVDLEVGASSGVDVELGSMSGHLSTRASCTATSSSVWRSSLGRSTPP